MTDSTQKSGLVWLWLSLLLFAVDYVTKAAVMDSMKLYESIELLPFFNFTYMHNYGAAFSFLSEAGGWQRWFLSSIAVAISALLLYWLRKLPANNWVLCGAYSLVLAGAIGNLVDRLVHGYVIDFLHFYYQNWHYPAFNIADMAIVGGAGLLLFDAFKGDSSQEKKS
ncbi:signal peptidase II [Pseudoalteromonas aurantia]|uniref:Lipoprotein signal peptidase n=1 Tax=Pseudoalteromonas aurantia TaxID=43654 RepID=A0A5S3VDV7_9GAMM|nr:signal peptidase II [Pseudoalteromonas aurantia]TMO64546.1 lipoprotein signal peptidase [Pseudoalteromonas aurantia]TMO70478.1 lipoprotein signal peptidase [Pseudoalteromonas aurantia]TMO77655.1 lipoprotein signal peptidase [Pseudoalteromonas aurantia]